jgi:hypothetical protein
MSNDTEEFEFIVWPIETDPIEQAPSRILAIGPETAARKYALYELSGHLTDAAPIASPAVHRELYVTTAASPDRVGVEHRVWRFGVVLRVDSQQMSG